MMAEFNQAVADLVRSCINEIHTAMPGKIVSFDASTGLATVLPYMRYKKPDGTTIAYPQITGVPVLFPQGNSQSATIVYPVKDGDGCLIIISENSIDYWMYGQETDTDLPFDLTNAICIPGLFSKANSLVKEACNQNAIILDAKGSMVKVKSDSVEISSNTVIINGDLKVTGKVTSSGDDE